MKEEIKERVWDYFKELSKKHKVDPIKRAYELRKTLIKDGKILVADLSNTLQGKDTSKVIDLMPNIYTGDYVFRVKVSVKEIDKIASEKYNTGFFDLTKHSDKKIEDFIKKQEFDFPLWFKHIDGFEMKKANYYNTPFILQVAGCNFHDGTTTGGCKYCFVDNKSNNGVVENGKAFLGAKEVVGSMMNARDQFQRTYSKIGIDNDMRVLRISGGEPTIVLDWILDVWRDIENNTFDLGDIVGQIDSNLSTGMVVDDFEKQGIYEKNILEKLAQYPIHVLTALKGCDEENLQENVQSTATMETQLYSIKKFIKAGFNIRPQMYNPNPRTLVSYLATMDNEIENFSSIIHIGPLKIYGPTKDRIKNAVDFIIENKNISLENKERQGVIDYVIERQRKEWDTNYKQGCEILDKYLRAHQGHGYKEVTRSDVVIRLKNN